MCAEVPFQSPARPGGRIGTRAWPWVLGGAACLIVPAVLNGVPFTYYDTVSYIARPDGVLRMLQRLVGIEPPPRILSLEELTAVRPEDHPVAHRGRSMFYRMFGWGAHVLGGLWPIVVLQALLVSATVMILWRRVLGWRPGPAFVAAMAALTVLTPLGYFTALVMPDVLSGLMVLGAGLVLLAWHRLSRGERVFLGLLLLFSAASHATHVLIGLGLLGLALLLWWPLRRAGTPLRPAGAAVLGGAVVVALLLELLMIEVYNRRAAAPMVTWPHITAGLLDSGPGTEFLRRNCPEAGFVMCEHLDRLPMFWIDFLFDDTDEVRGIYAIASPAEKRAISAEQIAFLRAVMADDPGGMVLYLVDQTARQLVRFGMDDAMIPPGYWFDVTRGGLTDGLAERVEASPLHNAPWLLDVLGAITHATALAALVAALVAVRRMRRDGVAPEARLAVALVLVLLAGLFLNAMICGTIAAPYDRFQARLIWLWPLAAMILLHLSRPASEPKEPSR